MSKPELIIAANKEMSKKRFVLGTTKYPVDPDAGELLEGDNFNTQFNGDDSAAACWLTDGLLRKNQKEGKQSVLIHNPLLVPRFPK